MPLTDEQLEKHLEYAILVKNFAVGDCEKAAVEVAETVEVLVAEVRRLKAQANPKALVCRTRLSELTDSEIRTIQNG